jgi:hypothetical protein
MKGQLNNNAIQFNAHFQATVKDNITGLDLINANRPTIAIAQSLTNITGLDLIGA